jgi:hypothetical protein
VAIQGEEAKKCLLRVIHFGEGRLHVGPLMVWDVESGRELRSLKSHSFRYVRGVALSEDGSRAVSASDDHTLKV